MLKIRQVLCHDCRAVLSADDRRHYVYQCHDCMVVEHDILTLARRDPDHPDVERLSRSAVHLEWAGDRLRGPQPA